MKILLHSHFPAGHAYPMQAVAQALVARGHAVVWLTYPDHESRVLATGARFVPTRAVASVDAPLAGENRAGVLDKNRRRHLERRLLAQVDDYRDVLADFPADVLLVDVFPHGARALFELGEIPTYATLGVIPLYTSHFNAPLPASGKGPPRSWPGWIANAAHQLINRWIIQPQSLRCVLNAQRRALGLGNLAFGEAAEWFMYSPHMHIQASSLELEFGQVPRPWAGKNHTVFVGPLATTAAADANATKLPEWWSGVLGTKQKIIGITQGTLAMDPTSLILPAINALRDDAELVLVVVSPYVQSIQSTVGDCPNVRYTAWLPYDLLLPRLALLVTNGGYGSITQAVSHGVPLLCAGQSEDKPDTAARVAFSGVGIDLGTGDPSVESVREAAYMILRDDSYRTRARRMGDRLVELGGAEKACDALEALFQTVKKQA